MYAYEELVSRLFEMPAEPLIAREKVVEFFVVFSRFEYALKRAGYVSGNERSAHANWDKFAKDIKKGFDPNHTRELQEAVTYLENYAPRKQVVVDNELRWQKRDRRNTGLLKWLLDSVRTVRNNLFHGEKFRAIFEGYPPERDFYLIQHSLVILYFCLDLCPIVRRHFVAEMEHELRGKQ